MNLRKQAIGIDISKATFTACLGSLPEQGSLELSPVEVFTNSKAGFNRLLRWAKPRLHPNVPLVFLMESTGVYYEKLAYHLHGIGKTVHVVLPNKSAYYGKSLNIKTKTDAIDARILAQFGLERSHRVWEPPCPKLAQLRTLTRYYVQLQEQKTTVGNLLESKQAAEHSAGFVRRSNKQLLQHIDRHISQCKLQIEQLICSDSTLKECVDRLASIKGVGRLTVAVIIAETRMFKGIHNVRELVSYAGYDVVARESGSSVKGKTRISKKGNRYIRNALYFPGMVSSRFNPELKEFYQRIICNKPSKMVGQVAVQRKLLVLMYSLYKHQTWYQPGYNKVAPPQRVEATRDSAA